jgi:hypothetical protein
MKPLPILPVPAALLSLIAALLFPTFKSQGAAPGDEHWDNQFGPVGVNDLAYSMTVQGSTIYVGGELTAAGNTRANHIAGYDGTNWFPLNKGIVSDFSTVYAVASDERYIYAGGSFSDADNSPARNIARWDGTKWASMGTALDGYVFALKKFGTNLYAAGIFAPTTNTLACLARWTGSEWSFVGGIFTGGSFLVAYALESDGTNIYLGGTFTNAGGTTVNNLAKWNGSSWSALGSGIDSGVVRALLYQSGRLYVGGSFTNTSGPVFTNLAVWDGVALGPWFQVNRGVRDFLSDGTNIYVSGEFTTLAGQSLSRIARFDGVNWFPLGTGVAGFGVTLPSSVFKMGFGPGGRLIAAGNFNMMGDVGVSHVAAWDGISWSGLGADKSKGLTHFNRSVNSSLARGTDLYVGGLFTEAGDKVVNGIARWDGSNWFTLGTGLTGTFTPSSVPTTARALTFVQSTLYVGGNFTNAGGIPAKGLARWNGTSWSGFGDADATVRALAYDFQAVWVGGNFTNIAGLTSPGLAMYIPAGGWVSAGILSGGTRSVNALARDGQNIYVGGSFTSISGTPLTNIARWNGSTLVPLGNGLNNTVNALVASNGIVYAGGTFTFAGGVAVNRIARWDGSSWSPLGSGVAGPTASTTVSSLLLRDSDLYATGTFTNAGGVVTLGLAKWDGATWSAPFGSGLIGSPGTANATTLAFIGNDLYVGGQFAFAGDKPSIFFARWNDQKNFYPTPNPRLINPRWVTNGQFAFRLAGTSGERFVIESTTNLTTWTPRLTNSTPLYDFIDPSAANAPLKSYRAVLR